MSDLAYSEKYTRKDHRQWSGDWELIHGDAYAMSPSPAFIHQYISLRIARQLDEQLEHFPQCHAVIETDVTLSEDTVVRPDSMVICYEPDEVLNRAPELVFEVVSPTSARRDEILKFDLYQTEGVKYYAIVYPDSHKAKLFELVEGKYRKIADFSDETVKFGLSACTLSFDFSFIWRRK